MDKEPKIENIVEPLVTWYQENKRILPWRVGENSYPIWISEIMLQQTRIEAVINYYHRFLQQLPTIQDLAEVEEEKLLKLWEGLGYYNRARNLKKAAQIIIEKYHGEMPTTYEELKTLPGIGEYTAGAIASIANNERVPAVDGNVLRVMSRIIGSKKDILNPKTKKQITNKLKEIMPKEAGDFNQALMELGETICIPKGEPLCSICPVQDKCVAKEKGLTKEIPVRIQKITRKQEEKTVFILTFDNEIAIRKRDRTGLLAGMYEFPTDNKKRNKTEVKKLLETWKIKIKENSLVSIGKHRHVFSHLEWDMIGYMVEVEKKIEEFTWVTKEDLEKHYPMPGPFMPFRKKIQKEE